MALAMRCGAACYFHSCGGCGVEVGNLGGWAGSWALDILFGPSSGRAGIVWAGGRRVLVGILVTGGALVPLRMAQRVSVSRVFRLRLK